MGVSLAASLVSSILTPKPKAEPALDDLSILKSEYGVPIPKVYGNQKVTGNVIWGLDIEEEEESAGGKGGGGGTTFKYYGTFAVLFCEGEIFKYKRIWLNNKLVYYIDADTDPLPPGSNPSDISKTVQQSQEFANRHLTLYTGTNTQDRDPLIESVEGTANTPAFRNYAYIVFDRLPLDDYGNVIPKVEVEVQSKDGTVTVAEVLVDLCGKAGLPASQVDATAITDELRGFVFRQGGQSPRDAIEQLQKVYSFIGYESRGSVFFTPLQVNEVDIIPILTEDLGVKQDTDEPKDLYTETQVQVLDLPSQLDLEYNNVFNQYDVGNQVAFKARARHVNEQSFKTNLALSDSEAKQACLKNLEYFWTQRFRYSDITLPLPFLDLRPGNVIEMQVRNSTVRIQLEKVSIGANTLLEIEGYTYSSRVNNIVVPPTADNVYNPPVALPTFGSPGTSVIETTILRDDVSQIGLYALPQSDTDPTISPWSSGTIFVDPANSGNFVSTITTSRSATYGVISGSLPTMSLPGTTDRGTILTVTLTEGTLDSLPDDSFYRFDNLIYINGEVIAFQNANLIAPDTYELTNLIRGVKGTESFIQNHPSGSSFFLISRYADIEGEISNLDTSLTFKSVPKNVPVSEITNTTSITLTGLRLKPFAPTFIKVSKKANNDWLIDWERRTRYLGAWLPTSEIVPLNEDIERYILKIYSTAALNTVVREVIVDNITEYIYTESDQIADFGTARTVLHFTVSQFSVLEGEGFVTEVVNRTPDIFEV